MKEIENRSKLSENTLAMMSPLVNKLSYNVIPYGNQLIMVAAPELMNINTHIKRYLNHLTAVRKALT